MNNSVYSFLYSYHLFHCRDNGLIPRRFDSIINSYLVKHCSLHPPTSTQIGVVVHSQCNFFGSVAFPSVVDLGLRVNNLGNSSVTYEVGVFEHGQDDVRAVGGFTHVFVNRKVNRPAASGMPGEVRRGLQRLVKEEKPKL